VASEKTFKISELFNTSSNENTGGDRVYSWGYLAVRYMMENKRDDVEQMLTLIRAGDWEGYQVLVRSWGTGFDGGFNVWLDSLSTESTTK
jgi:microbial collagenase